MILQFAKEIDFQAIGKSIIKDIKDTIA